MDINEFRPRLEKTKDWYELIEIGRDRSPREILDRYYRTLNSTKQEIEVGEQGRDYILRSESERIKTLEQLLEASDVDEEQFEVTRTIINKYDQHSVQMGLVELFQVKAWLSKKFLDKPSTGYLDEWVKSVATQVEPIEIYSEDPRTPIILAISDVHLGAFIENDRLASDYNKEVIKDRLAYVASVVNGYRRPVHVKFLGDMIESFTGKNKKDTWKQIEMHGMEVALEAFDLMREFLLALGNAKSVDFVGGNHDRIGISAEEDKNGQVVYLVAELLKRTTDLPIRFDPKIITSEHDGVTYILTHGDKKISKMLPSKLILEYGNQDNFNVLLNAHGHEEKIHENSIKFQARQIPPICVPNEYALENGWSSQSGFTIIDRSERGGVNVHTLGL